MKEGIVKNAYELLIKELQTVISISYITMVAIGMLFNYQKYSEFGINIFDYADVFDFLIAPFSDFYILLFSTASILFVTLISVLDSYWRTRWPKSYSKANFGRDKKSWYKAYRNGVFGVSFIIYIYSAADYYGRFSKEIVLEQKDTKIVFTSNQTTSGKLIGKTKDVIFILNGDKVSAFPIGSSVKEIQIN